MNFFEAYQKVCTSKEYNAIFLDPKDDTEKIFKNTYYVLENNKIVEKYIINNNEIFEKDAMVYVNDIIEKNWLITKL